MTYWFSGRIGYEYFDTQGNRLIVEDEIWSPYDDDVQTFLASEGYDGPNDWE